MPKGEYKIVIELKDVSKVYNMGDVEVHALRDVSMKIKKGEFVSVMGPSGSGKSTLMDMVGCLNVPTSGTVLLEGRDISKLSESGLARIRGSRIGFIFQFFNLYPGLTVMENVGLQMRIHDYAEKDVEKRVNELLKMVNLENRRDHIPSQLSGGEIQRVAIARALSTNPSIILADEPTGNVDTKTSDEIMDFFDELHESGQTIVMVTHEKDVAKRAQRTIHLRDGQITEEVNGK